MNAIIDRILIFGGKGEKREVSFTSGLNIITGDSKTGKSALIEIVDYCLLASRSTIPKGIIDDFARLFVIVLKAAQKYILIGRPNSNSPYSQNIILRIEVEDRFLEDINEQDLINTPSMPLKVAQEEVERHLGLAVKDTRLSEYEERRNAGKVTMRSMVSFMFQHQNLIANKHSLFYRFEDFNKRKKTIADFPILIGWESDEYFQYYRELESKMKELKTEERLAKKVGLNDSELWSKLRDIISIYYKAIGLEFSPMSSLEELKALGVNLPSISVNSYSDADVQVEIERLQNDRADLQARLSEKLLLLEELSTTSDASSTYATRLKKLEVLIADFGIEDEQKDLKCPVCKNHVPEVVSSVNSLYDSRIRLYQELSKIGTYATDNSEQRETLQKERDELKKQINAISIRIRELGQFDELTKSNIDQTAQAYVLKGATESNARFLINQSQILNGPDKNVQALIDRITWLRSKIEGFDLKKRIQDAESFLSKRMTEICDKLDFEAELKPGTLRFSLEDFSFYYHFRESDKVYLSEMGSGANWLAVHLSLFLALLHLNCKSNRSTIPSFLMLDQPSQVYFPRQYGRMDEEDPNLDENVKQVKNIFEVIRNEIVVITKDCGFEPQIIVMDHADESEFNTYVRKRWKKDGEKLI